MASLELETTTRTKSSSRDVVTNNSVERERFKKRALAIQREIRAYATSMKVMQRTFINNRPPCINLEEETKHFPLIINRLENAKRFDRKPAKYRKAKGLTSSSALDGSRIKPRPPGFKGSKQDVNNVQELSKKLSRQQRDDFRKGLGLPTRKFDVNRKSLCEPMVIVNPPSTLSSRPAALESNPQARSDSRALLRAHIEQAHPLISKHGRSHDMLHDSLPQMELNDPLFYLNDIEKPQIVVEEEENMKETQRKIKDFLDRTCAESVCSDTETPNFWSSDEKKRKVSRVYSLNTPYRSKACSTRSSVLGIHHEPTTKKKLGMQLPPMILPPIHTSCVYKPKARVWSVMKSATGGSPGSSTTGGSMLSDEDWEDLKRCRYLRIVEEVREDDTDDVFGPTTAESIIN